MEEIRCWNDEDRHAKNDLMVVALGDDNDEYMSGLIGLDRPAVLIDMSELYPAALAIIDLGAICSSNVSDLVTHVLDQEYEVFGCKYCVYVDNTTSIIVAPKGAEHDTPCIGCQIMIDCFMCDSDLPEDCETKKDFLEKILEHIRTEREFPNFYFKYE